MNCDVKNKPYKILLLLLSCYIQCVVAQDNIIQTQHYGVEEGLSHRDVQAVHKDGRGMLWFGTKYGLNRFDGYNAFNDVSNYQVLSDFLNKHIEV